ncbi:putative protein OS=Lysinibacillus sphaericus OX=1421 GN=LS41612_21275 PE=4 SV=1 [Lysinibacillus sphaericus]|uniref:Uncharacterized protein n=3 Tax=Lysinibacillus sphaericus TaxID=1421 RepID=A0A2S0K5M7_LYSSH|nr:hypothetical protein LS41612_21275 [Lysinibacillus sphaericus]
MKKVWKMLFLFVYTYWGQFLSLLLPFFKKPVDKKGKERPVRWDISVLLNIIYYDYIKKLCINVVFYIKNSPSNKEG